MNRNAMIAMSGGVDSSVAAYLMKERGFDCVGVTMKLFSNEDVGIDRGDTCCSLKDADDARGVAYRLGIPHYVFNFSEDFIEQVIRRFVEAYEQGLTPNPCIDCNRYIKFERLFLRAKELEYSFVVTGHYARIEKDGAKGRYCLMKALDDTKDQSYFLYSMTQDQLTHTLFPLGELRKTEVREIALAQGFLNARKRESQDVCFVSGAGKNYADFIEHYRGRPSKEGDFVDTKGGVLGRHKGLIRYTIGQRKGLGVALPRPLFVCGKDPVANTVTLGEDRFLYSKVLFAHSLNWIDVPPSSALRVRGKTRYRQPEQWATVERVEEDKMRVEFDEPQCAVAAGQAVVLYDENRVVGGGTIL
ncbi:MAG: tRNA 2-thiouridine(34) synthase MnmA [Synergistaceae bacterium]|jgi:tRNA-specific 2-thiouridylase|nr:tRNA 2-thiouridine(34) synthase MnmA [Synergistaceae bacterium]